MNWSYILGHPEVIFGWLLLALCIIAGAVWSAKVLIAKFKYTYEKEKDEAWQEEHKKRLAADKRCDELIEIAQRAANNHRIALMVLTKNEKAKRNQQKAN